MKQIDNILTAAEGMQIRRKSDGTLFGETISLGYVFQLNGVELDTPHKETADDFEEVFEAEFLGEKHWIPNAGYGEIVEYLIRLRYSASSEFSILRQRDEKEEAYVEYNDYCELCKTFARHLNGDDELTWKKEEKIAEITKYDKSNAVNEFSLFGNTTWLTLDKRIDMRQSLVSLKAKGFEEFTYWLGTIPITLPISEFESILDTVEVYAIQCFNVTASHKAAVLALESVEEVEAYDYKQGYPQKVKI